MNMKLMAIAALAAAAVSGSGIASADDTSDGPQPYSPMCLTPTEDGWSHTQMVPCGWTHSDARGWERLPPAP